MDDLKDSRNTTGAKIVFTSSKLALTPLPRWYKGYVILVGDAAHAVAASSSQGILQALEDAYVLSNVFKETLSDVETSLDQEFVERAGQRYQDLRINRVNRVRIDGESSQSKKGSMSNFEAEIMYAILRVLIKLGIGDSSKVGYDVETMFDKHI